MLKYVIMIVLFAITEGAPTSEPETTLHTANNPVGTAHLALAAKADQHPIPVIAAAVAAAPEMLAGTSASASASAEASSRPGPVAKQLLLADLSLVKTPASATKLTPLTAPLVGPITPLAYASPTILAPYPAWSGLAALPATYSIEQHGYHIAY